ncbi:MAG TPA: hypothetical protein P5239_10170 [Victivallales bacterium]|nr:hypothetical protein [Victivallales bacterium]
MSCNTCGSNAIVITSEEVKEIQKKYLKEKYPDGKFEHDGKTYAILIDGN